MKDRPSWVTELLTLGRYLSLISDRKDETKEVRVVDVPLPDDHKTNFEILEMVFAHHVDGQDTVVDLLGFETVDDDGEHRFLRVLVQDEFNS